MSDSARRAWRWTSVPTLFVARLLQGRRTGVAPLAYTIDIGGGMSYRLSLRCGCVVYVACHPKTGLAHKRVIETRGLSCGRRAHRRGEKLWLWELLPDPAHTAAPEFVSDDAGPMVAP